MDKSDIEYLERCLESTSKNIGLMNPLLWYNSGDTMINVANILEDEGYLSTASDAIRFFEKPWKWESDMQDIIDEFKGSDDFEEGE